MDLLFDFAPNDSQGYTIRLITEEREVIKEIAKTDDANDARRICNALCFFEGFSPTWGELVLNRN